MQFRDFSDISWVLTILILMLFENSWDNPYILFLFLINSTKYTCTLPEKCPIRSFSGSIFLNLDWILGKKDQKELRIWTQNSESYEHHFLQNFLFLLMSLLTALIFKSRHILAEKHFNFLQKRPRLNLKVFQY